MVAALCSVRNEKIVPKLLWKFVRKGEIYDSSSCSFYLFIMLLEPSILLLLLGLYASCNLSLSHSLSLSYSLTRFKPKNQKQKTTPKELFPKHFHFDVVLDSGVRS